MYFAYLIMPYIVLPFIYQFPTSQGWINALQVTMAEIVRGFPNYWQGIYYNIPVYYDAKELWMTVVVIFVVLYLLWVWKKKEFVINNFYKGVGVFLLLLLVEYLYTPDTYSGLKTCKGVALLFITGLYFSNLKEKKLKIVAQGVTIFALVNSIIGILQLLMVWYRWFPYLEVPGPGSNGYIFGTIGHINQFANMLTMSLFVVLFLFFNERRRLQKSYYFTVIVLSLFNIILTTCRSAWVAVIGTFILLMIFHAKELLKKKQLRYIVVLIFVIIGEFFLIKQLSAWMPNNPVLGNHNFKTSVDQVDNSHGRILLWEKNIYFITQHPIMGTGTGSYWYDEQLFYQATLQTIQSTPQISKSQADEMVKFAAIKEHSHNEYLQQFVENGVFGFLFLVSGVLALLYSYILLQRKEKTLEHGVFFFGVFSCFFIACFDFPWHMIHSLTWFSMILGAYIALLNRHHLWTKTVNSKGEKK